MNGADLDLAVERERAALAGLVRVLPRVAARHGELARAASPVWAAQLAAARTGASQAALLRHWAERGVPVAEWAARTVDHARDTTTGALLATWTDRVEYVASCQARRVGRVPGAEAVMVELAWEQVAHLVESARTRRSPADLEAHLVMRLRNAARTWMGTEEGLTPAAGMSSVARRRSRMLSRMSATGEDPAQAAAWLNVNATACDGAHRPSDVAAWGRLPVEEVEVVQPACGSELVRAVLAGLTGTEREVAADWLEGVVAGAEPSLTELARTHHLPRAAVAEVVEHVRLEGRAVLTTQAVSL